MNNEQDFPPLMLSLHIFPLYVHLRMTEEEEEWCQFIVRQLCHHRAIVHFLHYWRND